jgi:hypothetical protein
VPQVGEHDARESGRARAECVLGQLVRTIGIVQARFKIGDDEHLLRYFHQLAPADEQLRRHERCTSLA